MIWSSDSGLLFEAEEFRRKRRNGVYQVGRNHGNGDCGKDRHDSDDTYRQADTPEVLSGYFKNDADAVLLLMLRVHRGRNRQGINLTDEAFHEGVAVLYLRLMLEHELFYVFIFHHFVGGFSLSVFLLCEGVIGQ